MGFWIGIVIFLAVIAVLTWVGALMTKKNPDTGWEKDEDRPFIGHDV